MDNNDKIKQQDQEKTLNSIKESYNKNGRLVPFVGAGFSRNVKGFLSWEEFIHTLSEKLGENKYFLQNKFKGQTFTIMAAEYYACRKLLQDDGENTRVNRDSLRGKIQDEINTYMGEHKSEKSEIHRILLEKFNYIYTTKWDKLFETNDKKIIPVFTIGRISELPKLLKDQKKILIKMHGTCDEADSIIALETDYWDLVHGRHKNLSLNILFQHDIMQKDFLFIGFGFSDLNIINLIYIMDKLKDELDATLATTPKIFMVVFDDYDKYLKRYYADLKRVEVYFIENVAPNKYNKAIEKFLYELEDKEKEEEKIKSLEKEINNDYKKYLENEGQRLDKKIQFYTENIKSIGRELNLLNGKEENWDKILSANKELLEADSIEFLDNKKEEVKEKEPFGPLLIKFFEDREIIKLEKKKLDEKIEKLKQKEGGK